MLHRSTTTPSSSTSHKYSILLAGSLLGAGITMLPQVNLAIFKNPQYALMMMAIGAALICAVRCYKRHYALLALLNELLQLWRANQQLPTHKKPTSVQTFSTMCADIKRLFDSARDQQRKQVELHMQLSANQHMLSRMQSQLSVCAEFKTLFNAIGHYAAQIDESAAQIQSGSAYTAESFDALCEQSFNLQLLVSGMELLQERESCIASHEAINPTHILSRILLPLSSTLDARNMKLSSAAWSERTHVRMPPQVMETMSWLVLLGCLRYAEDESELTLSCEPATDGSRTFITVLVSELAPAHMHANERASFMDCKTKNKSAHMFAHTLAQSANVSIAQRLCEHYGGSITVHPHTPTRCLVEMALPC